MKTSLSRLFSLLLTLLPNLVVFNSNSVWAMTALEAETQTWSYTELTPLWVMGALDQQFCLRNPDYFRGCFAGLDSLAQQVNPNYRLALENEVKNQPVILATKTLRVVQAAAPVVREFLQQERDFWKAERTRYEAVSRLVPSEVAPEIQEIATWLMAQRDPLLPFEVARVINAARTYSYDPQSHYAPTFRYDARPVPIQRPEPGIKLVRTPKGWIVSRVLRPSSAYESGIQRGDILKSIDGKAITDLSYDDVVHLLEKKEGANIKVIIARENQTVELKLSTKMATQVEFILKNYEVKGQKFGYIGLETVDKTPIAVYCNHVAKELLKFERETRGLILDVRGLSVVDSFEITSCLAGYFLGSKQYLYTTKNIFLPTQIYKTPTSTKKVFWKPLVILQDEDTEGAIELLSGSLKQLGRAFVVGETSKGNGTETITSTIHRVDHFETSYVLYLPSGDSHHNVGVTPNIKVGRAETANELELTALRYSDIGVAQVIPGKIAPLATANQVDLVSSDCLKQQNVKGQYQALPLMSQDKDLQLLTGLSALYCTQ